MQREVGGGNSVFSDVPLHGVGLRCYGQTMALCENFSSFQSCFHCPRKCVENMDKDSVSYWM